MDKEYTDTQLTICEDWTLEKSEFIASVLVELVLDE